MNRRDDPADRPFPRRPGGVGRRTFLVASSAALAGCSGLRSGAAYEREDIDVSLTADCADGGSEAVVVTLSWQWAGDGGSAPDDVAAIYWDRDKWSPVEPNEHTSETVEFEGQFDDGGAGVRYRHDDAAAESGTTYSASVTLSPAGDFDPEVRNVFGKFLHVSDEADGTERAGRFGDVEADWDEGVANAEAGVACEDAGG